MMGLVPFPKCQDVLQESQEHSRLAEGKNVRRKLQELGLGCLFPLVAVGADLLVWVSGVCFPIPIIPFPMLGMKQGLCLL